MTYLNQFHKESTERMLRKLAEWKKSPTSSIEAAQRMKQNLAMALRMEVTYTASKALSKNMQKNIIAGLQNDDWTYQNVDVIISDLKPKNVLIDADGDLYVIDAEIKCLRSK